MVTFTCQHCNASLKKKVVDSHRFQCKRNLHLTCIDCLKDFLGNQYESHISCVSENERYGGKNYTASNSENKHAAWMTTIKFLLENNQLSKEERNVLKSASTNPNLPTNKKKFINYFTHLPPYFNKGEFIESIFDLVSTQHKKRQDANSEVKEGTQSEEQGKKEKKRKTISETQEDVDEPEPQIRHSSDKQKKKKKNKDKTAENDTANITVEQLDSPKENISNGITKKKDKKKKKSVSYDLDESQIKKDSLKESLDEAEAKNPSSGDSKSSNNQNEGEEETKLTKKEKKKLLKQQKYQAELESIENYQEEKENEPGVQEVTEKKKKSKRNKNIEGNNKGESFEQKRETKISVSEPDGKKIRLEDEEEDLTQEEPVVEKPKKFKWDKMIIQVLRGADDFEMPLKRLSKKVCGEYMLLFGDKENYEDILMMFNKKVVKTQGVRVFKDRAKLIC